MYCANFAKLTYRHMDREFCLSEQLFPDPFCELDISQIAPVKIFELPLKFILCLKLRSGKF